MSRERGDENRKAGVAVTPGRNGATGECLEIGHDPEVGFIGRAMKPDDESLASTRVATG